MENSEKSRLNNEAAVYTLEGRYSKASEIFELILESDPYDSSVLFNYGFNFLQWDKQKKAVEVFQKILSSAEKGGESPEQKYLFASVMEDCGTSCYDAGLYKEAEKYYMKAEAADPENSILMNHMGVLYFVTERFKDAVEYFEKAVKYDDKNTDAWFNLADTYEVLGKDAESKKAKKKFIELEEEN